MPPGSSCTAFAFIGVGRIVRLGRQLGANLDVLDNPARMAGLAAMFEAELSSRFSTSFSIVELDATKECHEVGGLMARVLEVQIPRCRSQGDSR